MKAKLRKLLWFILVVFEKGDEPYNYKPLNRTILKVVGYLFFMLCLIIIYVANVGGGYGFIIPLAVFFSVGFVCLTVGFLGNDRAVAKIWGNR
jgi:hypothetical protein